MALPDFIIVGAMKCGTSTLQAQLDALDGVFMTSPKEPNFFSDDAIFARGMGWYEGLFADAPPGCLKGEASTHYTKLPTYPACPDRLAAALPHVRLIYLIRDPFDRLVSHYIHEWTMGKMGGDIDAAVERHPELVAYGCYAMQIAPYVERLGREKILVLRLEDMTRDPQGTLETVGRFLGIEKAISWQPNLGVMNASGERLRRFPLYRVLIENPMADALRRLLIPKTVRNAVKERLRMRHRPALSESVRAHLAPIFAEDNAALTAMFPTLLTAA